VARVRSQLPLDLIVEHKPVSLTSPTVKRDGKEWFAEGPHSEEMRSLNKKFGILHGISSLLNLATFIGAVVYGFNLGARVQSIADKAI
jgi:hypothetical protein